jgi:hypothetical protein
LALESIRCDDAAVIGEKPHPARLLGTSSRC